MAGKNPWGGKSDSSDGPSGSGGGSDSDSGGSEKPKGPRNPWLPGSGGGGGEEPRRSANIEDIFKKRGPEGPRKGGGGPGGPNFQFPQRPGGKSWLPVAIGVVALAWVGTTSIHFVQPKEQGVVTTLGKFSRTFNPGTNWTLPAPFESVYIENVSEVRAFRIPEGSEGEKLILTGDQNLVNLSYLIRWNINDLSLYKFRLAKPIETVKQAAEAAMRSAVAEKTLDDTFSGEGRAQIEERVRTRMQAILDGYKAGITVQGVEIDKTDPPEQVSDAFKDVSAAEQDADAARNRSRGVAQQILAAAEGETAAFDKVYEQYRLAPEVTRQRLYYETMERVLSQTDKTIVETNGVTTYLPLPEIRKRAQAAPPASPPAAVEGQ
ncbi:protease modulator HflK [Altererythrobacter gangjinensis]|uniref:Protease modulator HflK n=2 Tax=Pontixanthobacter gangjinensis TaxID=1028742 RepID=A0A6I4SKH7_9SPHN|nr:protease modulator HflK [Pontixanthobacter gangjinensis]